MNKRSRVTAEQTQPADVIKSSIAVMALFLLNQTHWCMCVRTAESWIVLMGISP